MVKKYLDMQIYLHIYIYDINISSPFQKTDSIRMLNLFKQMSSILSTKVRMEAPSAECVVGGKASQSKAYQQHPANKSVHTFRL